MLSVTKGTCYVQFAYDVAFSIDLAATASRIRETTQRVSLKHRRSAPKYFRYEPAPIRLSQSAERLSIAGYSTIPNVEILIYDFGGVSLIYGIPIEGPLSRLLDLSYSIYENLVLQEDARTRIAKLVELLNPALTKPGLSAFSEDYAVFQIESFDAPISIQSLFDEQGSMLARILRAETIELSNDEIKDSLSHRISFGVDDVAIIDWNGAVVIDREPEDILAVLEFANVELMEMRYLDNRLDQALALAYETLNRKKWNRFPFGSNPADLQRVAQWQVESAILFEGVNNALKLLGDQYLARLYRLAAERFHLAEWDTTIIRKLETLNSIYGKISDQVASRRMEALEWIIIALIAISILLPFFY